MIFLREKFNELFQTCHLCNEILDLLDDEKASEFILEKIRDNFSKEEVKEKYRDYPGIKSFISLVYGECEVPEERELYRTNIKNGDDAD